MTPDTSNKPCKSLIDRLVLVLATGFGVGYIPVMPGTFGSLWGPFLVWGLLLFKLSIPVHILVCLLIVLIGIPICTRASQLLERDDPGSIVYDEIAAFPIVFAVVELNFTVALLGFLWFRFFDILKPWPICLVDRIHGGIGVMADDLVAGVFAGAALWGTVFILGL